jgi:N-dimethylarginine dimethylaminohydrolase
MIQTKALLQIDRDHIAHLEDRPGFLMNVPFSISSDVPNNSWMDELSADELIIDKHKAIKQFAELYSFMTRHSLVYLLPSYPGLQDQTYVANLGIVLPHIEEKPVVISNYRSKPRRGESAVGREFFKMMKYPIVDAPCYFEGEADLKHIRDNLYIGAHGLRTSKEALDWFSDSFDMQVIPFLMKDSYLYHLDCCLFPFNSEYVAVCTEVAEKETVRELEKYVDIYDVSLDDAYNGFNNSVVLGKYVLCASNLSELKQTDKYYQEEKAKVESMNAVCASLDMEPVFFNLSEFYKSGALLSCLVMHLNRNNY